MKIKKHLFPTIILGGILVFGLLLNPAFVGALIIVTGPTTTVTHVTDTTTTATQSQYSCTQCRDTTCSLRISSTPCANTCRTNSDCQTPTTTHSLCHDSSCTTTTTRPHTTTTTTHPLCHDPSCTTTTTCPSCTTTTTKPPCTTTTCCPSCIKYTCNSNYQCVVASNGEYTSLSTCNANCNAPIRYACNTNTYQCYATANGQYTSLSTCDANCNAPCPRYTCNSNYQCVVASNGEYASLSTCQNNCIAPARYACNTSTYQCYVNTNGSYGNLTDCQNNCQPPITRYACNANYQCYAATFGTYGSYNDCLNACQPPITRYTCNTNYQCVVASNGEYASLSTCQNNCQQIIQPLSVSCYASPNYPQINQTVTFYSNVSGGSGNYTYYWSGYASGNGSYSQQTFSSSGTYSANLMVYDSNGRSGSTSCSAYVQGQSILTPTLNFWADKYTLNQGEATYLRWTSNNTNYCVASNGWSGSKSTSNYESTAPNSQTTYTLTCYGNGGQVTQSLTLYVTSPTTTLNFTKLGRNLSNGDRVYSKVIRVAQSDIIEFYLTVAAGSSADLQNVVLTDNLPSVLSYQSGTTKVDGIIQTDGITTTGLSLGTIARGTYKTVVFQVLSNNPGTYLTYTNTAQVTASGVSAISDSATITFGLVAGASTVQTGAEDSLWISFIISMGLAFLIWYYVKFNPQGKLVFAKVENKIRDLRLEYLRRQIIKK
jgi:uncharacterized repeat protein (TIGR01451 family)